MSVKHQVRSKLPRVCPENNQRTIIIRTWKCVPLFGSMLYQIQQFGQSYIVAQSCVTNIDARYSISYRTFPSDVSGVPT